MTTTEIEALHYATGILMGLGMKYGVLDLNIYYNSVHIRIERNAKTEPGADDRATSS